MRYIGNTLCIHLVHGLDKLFCQSTIKLQSGVFFHTSKKEVSISKRDMVDEKKFYLTEKGLERVKNEYKALREFRLAKTRGGDVPEILHSEDFNPEYLAFREDISLLEVKIANLKNVIKNAILVTKPAKEEKDIVRVGATVTLQIDDGSNDEFQVVGTLEANPSLGKISNESPVGKALMGHKVGDEIVVSSPIRTVYRVKKIIYP